MGLSPDDARVWKRFTDNMGSGGTRHKLTGSTPDRRASDRTIDLHGLTVQKAHSLVRSFLESARRDGIPTVRVITGKSGRIRSEFPVWMDLDPNVGSATEETSGGSFSVAVRRS